MPTARGWVIACAGAGLWIAGRTFGEGALEQLGFGLLILVLISVFVVRRGRHEISVARVISPQRAQAGREVTVALTLENRGRGSSPVLFLEDHLPARLSGRARFSLAGIEMGGERRATYKLRPARRGSYRVGPLEVVVSDPFGVATRTTHASSTTTFLIHPRIEPLTLPREAGRRRTSLNSARRNPTGTTGEDFYTLREYVDGDDLRRIHWPATAKRGRYMIRQEETPWHARATVVLDDRPGVLTDEDWERAVDASASLIDMFYKTGYRFRLTAAVAPGIPSARGSDHLHRCLDMLAVATRRQPDPDPMDPLMRKMAEIEAEPFAEGSLMLVTGLITSEAARALALASRRFRMVGAVSIVRAAPHDPGPLSEASAILTGAGVKHLRLGPGDSFGGAWSAAWRAGTLGPSQGGESPSDLKRARA